MLRIGNICLGPAVPPLHSAERALDMLDQALYSVALRFQRSCVPAETAEVCLEDDPSLEEAVLLALQPDILAVVCQQDGVPVLLQPGQLVDSREDAVPRPGSLAAVVSQASALRCLGGAGEAREFLEPRVHLGGKVRQF